MTIKLNKFAPLRLDLQYFNDGDNDPKDPPEGDPKGDPEDKPKEPDNKEKVELTQEELEKKIEAESDRKLASALEKKQREWKEQQQKAIEEAIAERERLSKLSEKERKQEELTKKEREIAEREAKIARAELKAEAVEDLQKKELPSSFAEFLLGEDAEKTLENINSFKEAFDKAVNEAVKAKLRQETPGAGSGKLGGKVPSVAELAKESRIIKN